MAFEEFFRTPARSTTGSSHVLDIRPDDSDAAALHGKPSDPSSVSIFIVAALSDNPVTPSEWESADGGYGDERDIAVFAARALNPNMRLTDSLGSATHLRIHILRNCHIAFANLSGGENIENRSAAVLTEAGGGEKSC